MEPERENDLCTLTQEQATHAQQPVVQKHKCPLCTKLFSTKKTLANHMLTHGKCTKCDKVFPSKVTLKKHMKEHVQIKYHGHNKELKCTDGGKFFMSRNSLKDHMMWHNNELKCADCGKFLKSRDSLSEHMKRHEEKFKCTLCNPVYPHPSALLQHMNWHKKVTSSTCIEYNISFSTPFYLKAYVSNGHMGKWACTDCKKTYELKELDKHVLKEHFSFCKCEKCDQIFENEFSLRNHLSMHEKQCHSVVCIDCSKEFDNDLNLQRHCRIHFISYTNAIYAQKCSHPLMDRGAMLEFLMRENCMNAVYVQ